MRKYSDPIKNIKGFTRNSSNRHVFFIVLVVLIAAIVSTAAILTLNNRSERATALEIKAIPEEDLIQEQSMALPQQGGQLLLYVPANSISLDPLNVQTTEMKAALSLCYEPLISYDVSGHLVPCLAESWEALDETGTRWRLSLRKDVYWHNSSEMFTAADVIYTIGLLKGAGYSNSIYAEALQHITDYQAEDDHTLLILTDTPGLLALHGLTFPVVSRKSFAADSQPVGTGPYIMTKASKEEGLEFAANSHWWKQQPYIQSIVAYAVEDNEAALGALEMSQINYATTTLSTVNKYREAGKSNLLEVMTQQCETMLINHNQWRLQDVRVRKAIAYALDKRDIINKAYINHAYSADVPVPPDSWLYDSSSKIYDCDVNKAKTLLKEAGWEDLNGDGVLDQNTNGGLVSFRINLLVNDTPDNQVRKDAANLIKTQLAAVGIDVQIVAMDWAGDKDDYLRALESGGFDLALCGLNLDLNGDLRPLLAENGSKNYGKYSSATLDARLNKAASSATEKELKERMYEVQQQFVRDLPFITLYFRTGFVLCSDSLQGVQSVRMNLPLAGLEKWYFDAQGRSQYQNHSIGTPDPWASFDLPVPEETQEQ